MAKKEIITKGSYQQKELHSEEMSIALTSIITNIKNMWNDNTIFKKTSRSSFECFIKITLGWKQGYRIQLIYQNCQREIKIDNSGNIISKQFFFYN